jgi:hypothetical protein
MDGARGGCGEEFMVPAGEPGIELYVRNKRPGALARFTADNVVLFVHGAGTPAEVSFDVPYKDYSWMAYLAHAGFDVFSMDMTGYGRSTRPNVMNDACNLSAEQQTALGRTQHPRSESIAVGAWPIAVEMAVRIRFRPFEHVAQAARFRATPLRCDAGRSPAHVRIRILQIAMHVADAVASGIARLPHLPPMACPRPFFEHDEPIVVGDQPEHGGQRSVTELDYALR